MGQRNFPSELCQQGRYQSAPLLTPENWSEIYSLYGVSDLSDLCEFTGSRKRLFLERSSKNG